ncbi:CD209 antigen-like protein E [Carassius carassius]|uniref:CD209 antigen-like protein E n=1 Tax=Carassius carassius TaxID=217509 RepID=UPI002868659A|nr:CD209 antigen-like protein E [Carassius carassius]
MRLHLAITTNGYNSCLRTIGGSRCLVLITVCFQIICVLLLINNILLHITIRTDRDLIKSYKNTVEEFNQTINSLQDNTDLMTEKHQLQNNLSSLSQKNLELKARVKDLTDEKKQLQRDFDFLNKKGSVCFFMSTESKSWSDSRQYCRDRGADLVIINTEEKQRFISSLVKERVWIGLSDRENEGVMKWVDNSTLNKGFWLNGEPNNYAGKEDCIELNYYRGNMELSLLNNWNDLTCSDKKKGICEK